MITDAEKMAFAEVVLLGAFIRGLKDGALAMLDGMNEARVAGVSPNDAFPAFIKPRLERVEANYRKELTEIYGNKQSEPIE